MMAHCMKIKKSSVGALLQHDTRSCNNHSNEEIDISRSSLNYDLCDAQHSPVRRYAERIAELNPVVKKSTNVMCQWVVTLPEDLKANPKMNEFELMAQQRSQELFFEEAYTFLKERYGEKNIVSAIVHVDETTPHLHFNFVPVIDREGKDFLCAKEVITRNELRKFHRDLEKHMSKVFGFNVGILNGKTKGVATVEAYKEITRLEKEIVSLKNQLEDLRIVDANQKNKLKETDKPKIISKGVFEKNDYIALKDFNIFFKKTNNLIESYNTVVKSQSALKMELKHLEDDGGWKGRYDSLEFDYQQARDSIRTLSIKLEQAMDSNNDLQEELGKSNEKNTQLQRSLNFYQEAYSQFLNVLRSLEHGIVDRIKKLLTGTVKREVEDDLEPQKPVIRRTKARDSR